MHSANDVAVASSLTSTTLSSRITVGSSGGSRRASVSALSRGRSERSKATKQCTLSAKDKFDGWQRATSLNKSVSLNTSSRSVHSRRIQAQPASRLPAPICNRTTMAAHAATPGHENERYSDSAGGEVFKGHWWLRPATEPDPAGVQVPPTGATQARGSPSYWAR